VKLASRAFGNVSGVIHRLLLDPVVKILKWLCAKVSSVSLLESLD